MGLAYNNSKICNMLQYLDKAKGEKGMQEEYMLEKMIKGKTDKEKETELIIYTRQNFLLKHLICQSTPVA